MKSFRTGSQVTAAVIDLVVCTTGGRYLLDRLPVPGHLYSHHATQAEPRLLGFECQTVLRDRLGAYDFYCYLEDDLVLGDPWFFRKLVGFNGLAGAGSLLQPNRFEASPSGPVGKLYLDGDLAPRVTAPFQDVTEAPEVTGLVLGTPVSFRRALNPHSGCYFLTAEQMDHWAKQSHFGARDTRFIGPLESAATLGIMRTFRVYKPAPANASFLEVQHYGTGYLGMIGRGVPLRKHPPERPQPEPSAPSSGDVPDTPPTGPDGPGSEDPEPGPSGLSGTFPVRSDDRFHVLFVHQNFPAQFGHVARYLVKNHGFQCTFVSRRPAGVEDGVERIHYRLKGGATPTTHYCSRNFENAVWHSFGVYKALAARPDIRPDVVVGHSGFASTLFLRDLYDCPIINYFEFFYRPEHPGLDSRPDFPSPRLNRLRSRVRNGMLLLDLENCDQGYSPTHWQHDRLPAAFHDKVRVVFDGIDTDLWRPLPDVRCRIGGRVVPDEVRLVTYASRGLESMRGFDVFMKVAKRLCDRRQDVVFAVVGEDRGFYSGDEQVTGGRSFREWVLSQDDYDLSRFFFLGRLPAPALARLLAVSDLHVYLTVPFILSWSLLNALACGATVLASRVAPVCEVIEHGKNGLLADFFDIDGLSDAASAVLDAPRDYRHLGQAGVETVRDRYSLVVCVPQMLQLYQDAIEGRRGPPSPARPAPACSF